MTVEVSTRPQPSSSAPSVDSLQRAVGRCLAERTPAALDAARELTRAAAESGDASAVRILAASQIQQGQSGFDQLALAADLGDRIAARLMSMKAGTTRLSSEYPVCGYGPELLSEQPFIGYCEAFLTGFECEYLIAASESAMRDSLVLDAKTGLQSPSECRVSESKFWRPETMDIVLFSIFQRAADAAGSPLSLAEPLSVVRYRPGGKFLAHLDAFPNPKTLEMDGTVRQSTTILYLNEGYTGGETAFLKPKLKVRGGVGDLLHFRNLAADGTIDEQALHAGMPVLDGEKWVAVLWMQRGSAPSL